MKFTCIFALLFINSLPFSILCFDSVIIPDEDLIYLNERLQLKVHMNREDALNSIIELENYYTGLKNDLRGSPSEMVDEAWHAHILNTPMYFRFSKATFGSYLHHLPFWSGNRKEADQLSDDIPMVEKLGKLGIKNINETVWTHQSKKIKVDGEKNTTEMP